MTKWMYKWILIAAVTTIFSCTNNREEDSDDTYLYQMLTHLMLTQLQSEGYPLNMKIVPEDSASFSNEMKTFPKFVFYHSELNCNSCVEENSTLVTDFCNEIGKENVIFIASYRNKRDLHVFKRINKISSYIYNAESVELPITELNLPFCFVVNEHYKTECVYIPLKEDPSAFKSYLQMIKKKYFDQKASTYNKDV